MADHVPLPTLKQSTATTVISELQTMYHTPVLATRTVDHDVHTKKIGF